MDYTADDLEAQELQALTNDEVPDNAEAWYLRSYTTLEKRTAIEFVGQSLTCEPNERLAHLCWERLAYLCFEDRRPTHALAAAERLIALGRDRLTWMMFKGHVLTKQRRYDEAVEQYTRVSELFPDSLDPYRPRAVAYLCQQKYVEAIKDYSIVAGAHCANQPWVCYQRATPLWIVGESKKALEDYRAFTEGRGYATYADARLALVLHDQARLLDQAGGAAEAEKARGEAKDVLITARGDSRAEKWLQRILKCLDGELPPDELVDDASGRDNEEHLCEAYYYAGEAHRLSGNDEKARECFEKCVDTDVVLDLEEFPPDPMNEYVLAVWRLDQLAETYMLPSDSN